MNSGELKIEVLSWSNRLPFSDGLSQDIQVP